MPPDRIDLKRLVKLLGMMGSDHVGERAAAAGKADAMVRKAGLTWGDVIAPGRVKPGENPVSASSPAKLSPRQIILDHRTKLSEWEYSFLCSLFYHRRRYWTDNQRACFERIERRVRPKPKKRGDV